METERIPNHRLVLRRNKRTGRWEVYRHFHTCRIIELKEAIVETGEDLQAEEVAFKGNFQDAVEFANKEKARYGSKVKFEVCEHKSPNINRFCPDAVGRFPALLEGVVWMSRKFRRPAWYRLIRRLLQGVFQKR